MPSKGNTLTKKIMPLEFQILAMAFKMFNGHRKIDQVLNFTLCMPVFLIKRLSGAYSINNLDGSSRWMDRVSAHIYIVIQMYFVIQKTYIAWYCFEYLHGGVGVKVLA